MVIIKTTTATIIVIIIAIIIMTIRHNHNHSNVSEMALIDILDSYPYSTLVTCKIYVETALILY